MAPQLPAPRRPSSLLALALAGLLLLPSARGQSAPDTGPYLQVVRRAADALLETGRDTYGEQKSGMILSVLDRQTAKPRKDLPPAPFGVRGSDRTRMGGCNTNLQQDLYRALEHLSRLTGDPKYNDAVKPALTDFLSITQDPTTGFLAWGEHLYWDCMRDRLGDSKGDKTHEQKRKFIYFDYLYDLDPERTLKYAHGLWDHQIGNQKTGDFSRHAKYDEHKPSTGYDFPKEGSYFIDVWSKAYARTHDPVFTHAITVLANRYLARTNERGLMDFDTQKDPERHNRCVALWLISLSMESDASAARVDPPTAELLKKLAAIQDAGFLALAHEPDKPEKGFVCYAATDTGEPRPWKSKESSGYSAHWGMGYGINTTSMFGLLCYARQAQLGAGAPGDVWRKLTLRAADLYKTVKPDLEKEDIWSGEYGMALSLEVAAYRLSKDPVYLTAARAIADDAIRLLFDNNSPLPRASTKTDYYDVIAYPDALFLGLLALHEALAGLEPKVEITDLNR